MKLSNIPIARLRSQHIGEKRLTSAKSVVAWMGALQAQDYPMAKWAIGTRLPGSTLQAIDRAIEDGSILRTHILRPTWHFTTAEDISWLIDLSAAQLISAQRSRDRILELDNAVYSKSNALLEKSLSHGRHLTRDELSIDLKKAKIATNQNRLSHLLMRAEIEKIICSGIPSNAKVTYALFAERAPKARKLPKDEGLFTLAKRYFTSRCPASAKDFAWWSGLPAADVKLAVEMIKREFNIETIDGKPYFFPGDFKLPDSRRDTTFLLPTYDEYIISYADRGATITTELETHLKIISNQGVFRPILVINGQVRGIWKRTFNKSSVMIDIQPFDELAPSFQNLINQSASQFAHFVGKELEIKT